MEWKWLLQNTHMHHPLKVLIKQNIVSLMLHGVPGPPLLWCFQLNNKSQGPIQLRCRREVLWMNPYTCCSLVFLCKGLIVMLLSDVMLSFILTSWSVKNIFSSFLLHIISRIHIHKYIYKARPRWSRGRSSLSLKSHNRQGNFAAEVVQFSLTYRVVKKFHCVQ